MVNDTYDPGLGEALGFGADDLALNDDGRLSATQEAMVVRQLRRSRRWTIVAAVVVLGTVGALTAVALVAAGDNRSGGMVAAFAGVCGVTVAAFALSVLVGHRRSRDLRRRTISTANGPVSTRVVRMHSNTGGLDRFELDIGSTRILLSTRRQLDAFTDGEPYTVHHLRAPGTAIVLSARKLR